MCIRSPCSCALVPQGLAPYDLEGHAHWRALTGFITQATLSRVSPVGRLIGTDDRMGGADEGPQVSFQFH